MPLDKVRRKAFNDFNAMVYEGQIKIQKINNCFCGGNNFLKLSKLDRYGLPFGTQICKNCGLISQNICLTEDSLPIFYDKIYWPLNHGNAKDNSFATDIGANEFARFLSPEIRNRFSKKIKIFEVGCGQGDRLLSLTNELNKDFEVETLGCDYSEEAILASKKNGINIQKGGTEVFSNMGLADVVILSHVFEHVVDLNKFMSEIENISHENSLIYIEVPGVTDLKNKEEYEYDYQDYCVVAHIHNFSLSTLINVLSTRGFIAIKGVEFVRLIVSKTGLVGIEAVKNPFSEIIESLEFAQGKREQWLKKYRNPIRSYFSKVAKAILAKD